MEDRKYDEVRTGTLKRVLKNEEICVVPRANISETDDQYEVSVEMPGASKDGLSVHVENDRVIVEGRRVWEETGTLLLQEIPNGHYRRTFRVGPHGDTKTLAARWQDGVLRITLDKKQSARVQEITIHFE